MFRLKVQHHEQSTNSFDSTSAKSTSPSRHLSSDADTLFDRKNTYHAQYGDTKINDDNSNDYKNPHPSPSLNNVTPPIENRKKYSEDPYGDSTADFEIDPNMNNSNLNKKPSPTKSFNDSKSRKNSDNKINNIDSNGSTLESDKNSYNPSYMPRGEPSSTVTFPSSDLSSRVIVATDLLGFIRVFVRSGRQSEDDKKVILGLKQMKL